VRLEAESAFRAEKASRTSTGSTRRPRAGSASASPGASTRSCWAPARPRRRTSCRRRTVSEGLRGGRSRGGEPGHRAPRAARHTAL